MMLKFWVQFFETHERFLVKYKNVSWWNPAEILGEIRMKSKCNPGEILDEILVKSYWNPGEILVKF